MKKLKLNDGMTQAQTVDGYKLVPTEKYVINLEEEIDFSIAVMQSIFTMGFPKLACMAV